MLVTLTVLALVIGALSTVLIHATLARLSSTNRFESLQTARAALDMIARDLRSAGYGVDAGNGAGAHPAIAYVDSMQIIMCEDQLPYPDASGTGSPQAYNPSGSPKPQPLIASSWTPPVKYGTGAELVRYTLDLNDDGKVDASDIASAQGTDARRTKQPADYTLVREVYGDYSGNVAGNNGGSPERVALVMKPGGTVLPMFNVYLGSSTTPWNWSNGAVPAAQLSQITRVEVNVTASSPSPDSRGLYTMTPLVNQVLLQRNAPNFGTATYTVDGWVYEDDNANRSRDNGEPGLAGASVRLGNGRVVYTNSSGYYAFRVPAGTYLLKHSPPAGFGSFSNPDSFNLSVAAASTRSFADTLRTGGWVTVNVFEDTDGNGTWGNAESGLGAVNLSLTPAGTGAATNASGVGAIFAATGSWNVSATPPANYSFTTTNPQPVTMTAGGTATVAFGMQKVQNGTIKGRVYYDKNANGTYDGTDAGIANVTVSVKDALGLVTLGTGTSDASGNYSITAPATALGVTYQVACAPVAGYFATSALALLGVTLGSGATVSGKDFGFGTWTLSTITTGAVTCMATGDVWEDDANGSPSTIKDVDLVVGYNGPSGGDVGIWTNNYPKATPFSGSAAVDAEWWTSAVPLAVVVDSVTSPAKPTAPYPVIGSAPYTYAEGTYNWGYDIRSTWMPWPWSYWNANIEITSDKGTVQSMLACDMDGGTATDLILGSKTSAGAGSMQVWHGKSSNGTLSWTADEVYPAHGTVPGNKMGEVNDMVLGDIDRDGKRDLIVATQTSSTSGAVMIFQFNGGSGFVSGDLFTLKQTITFPTEAPQEVAVGDIDNDGWNDIVVGTQASTTTGNVFVEQNTYAKTAWSFTQAQSFKAPGVVTALAIGDVGGSSLPDVVVGYGSSTVSNLGGARIFYDVAGTLDTNGIDPTSGSLTRWVTAICLANFNYGTSPSAPAAPYLTDIAIGWKQSTTAGGVTIVVR
jgi:hypothetical protein